MGSEMSAGAKRLQSEGAEYQNSVTVLARSHESHRANKMLGKVQSRFHGQI
jgi:hypothetical protein